MKRSLCIKLLSLSLIGLISFNSYIFNNKPETIQVKATQTVEELETLKAENQKKIEQLQEKILQAKNQYDSISKDETAKLEYQDSLNEKISLQNQNIQYVRDQIDKIDIDIQENESQIKDLEIKIRQQNEDIEESISLFKQRLRVSYMSGNDTLAAVFTGSADFYDLLAKIELVSKVAEHDDDLIKTLKTQLEELDRLNITLEAEKNELNQKMADAVQKKEEFSDKLDALNLDYQNTQAELDRINNNKKDLSQNIEEYQKTIEEDEAEHDKIVADIAAVQEAIRAEAERKANEKKAEEERIAAENAKREDENKKQQSQQQTPSEPQTPSQPQTPSTPVSSGMAWPVPNFYALTSQYGYRSFDNSFHRGIDISSGGIMGASIVAADSGVVAYVTNSCSHNYAKYGSCGCGGGYGNYLTIVHNDGTYSTLYGHCKDIFVTKGQTVTKGQVIASVGTTGYSTGAHLHFEVLKNGSNIDPMSMY